MNVRMMKALDSYAGLPICMLLDIISRVLRVIPSKRASKPVSKILIAKFFGIGSVVLSTPMLRAVRQSFPDAKITFFTFASNREIVERLELVDDIITLRTSSLLFFAKDLLRALVTLRKRAYDVTIDMEFFAKFSTIVTYLSGSPMRIGYYLRQLWRGDLLTHHVYFNHYKHISEVFIALVAPLGVSVHDYSLKVPQVSDADMERLDRLFEALGVRGLNGYVVINVNASDMAQERRWPPERFNALVDRLIGETVPVYVFIGGKDDVAYVDSLVSQFENKLNRIVNLAGKTDLGQLLALIKRASLLITNDSGPLHLAAALGTPTVSFFGPETPMLYGPIGDGHLIFYSALYCSPCLNVFNAKTAQCAGNNICMKSIEVEDVFEKMKAKFPDIWQREQVI